MADRPEVTATSEHLPALLNALYDARRNLVVRYPLFDLKLFEYDPAKGEFVHWVDLDTFEEARSKRLPSSRKLAQDLPQWTDLGEGLLSAGARTYENYDEIVRRMRKAREMAQDATNPDPVYFAFDTNVLYQRLATRWLPERILPEGTAGLRYVISDAVRDELDTAIYRKYREADVRSIRASVVNSRQAKGLRGRPFKKGRRAKAALADVVSLVKDRHSAEADARELTEDKEKNDRIIARSYAEFAKDRAADVVLLTSDLDMASHARAVGIGSQYFDPPKMRPPRRAAADEAMVSRLVHDLAVSLGVLTLGGLDTSVWGIWPGKSLGEWDEETLRFDCNPTSGIVDQFREDLEAIRVLENGGPVEMERVE